MLLSRNVPKAHYSSGDRKAGIPQPRLNARKTKMMNRVGYGLKPVSLAALYYDIVDMPVLFDRLFLVLFFQIFYHVTCMKSGYVWVNYLSSVYL